MSLLLQTRAQAISYIVVYVMHTCPARSFVSSARSLTQTSAVNDFCPTQRTKTTWTNCNCYDDAKVALNWRYEGLNQGKSQREVEKSQLSSTLHEHMFQKWRRIEMISKEMQQRIKASRGNEIEEDKLYEDDEKIFECFWN